MDLFSMNRLLARKRPTRLLKDSLGDPGPIAITKIGGIPFWPRGLDRPTCSLGHRMAFLTQIRLGDVPGWNDALDLPLGLSWQSGRVHLPIFIGLTHCYFPSDTGPQPTIQTLELS